MAGELWQLGARELREAYRRGATSPVEVIDAAIARISALDGRVGAITTTTFEPARADARRRTDELRSPDRPLSPLHGVPVVVKELYDVAGAETTYGSAMLRGRVPDGDAEAVARLRRAGAVVVGLGRSHEFAWGITTQNERAGGTRNPWDLERVPGGSSGGAAAAVALGYVPVALGSDTGGSIRIPACFCGVAGFKPSYGAVPLEGVCPLAPSLDHGGPLARSVGDLADATNALVGTAHPVIDVDPAALRAGTCPDLHVVPLADDHREIFEAALEALREKGTQVIEVRFPGAAQVYDTFTRIQLFEAYHVHTDVLGLYPGRAPEYSESVAARLELARAVTAADYEAACAERTEIRARFGRLFEEVDVLVTPVSAGGPSFVERPNSVAHRGGRLPFRELVMHYSVPQNVAGVPAVAVPAGVDRDGLPVGVQVSAPVGADGRCLGAARLLSELLDAPAWPPLALEN